MEKLFQVAQGSVAGRDHVIGGRNNQDSCAVNVDPDALIAVVCDGCSDGAHNEVGAHLGVRLVLQAMRRHIDMVHRSKQDLENPRFWESVRFDVLSTLRTLAQAMGQSLREAIHNHFLFTVVGALITPRYGCTFNIGDGVVVTNGEITSIGPFPDNQPPYLSYALLQTSMTVNTPELLQFQLHAVLPTDEIDSILVGTDGLGDLIGAEEKKLPGKNESVGPLSQFWMQDRYFANPDAVRRRLALINHCSVKPSWAEQRLLREPGHLSDDTSFVVIRRRPTELEEV